MNILEIDINRYIPDIIDAYTEIWGNEFRDIIEKRINNIAYVIYNNIEGIESYCYFLKDCKKKELSIKFLKQIGINLSKYEKDSYAEKLDEHINSLLDEYFGNYRVSFEEHNVMGIKAFDVDETNKELALEELQEIKENRIRFFNFLRETDVEQITEDTFDSFCTTSEYQNLLSKINTYLAIYREILKEYQEYLNQIEQYYSTTEIKRKNDVFDRKKHELFEQIYKQLPSNILEHLEEKFSNMDEKCDSIFTGSMDTKFYIEYFSEEYNTKLNSDNIDEIEKHLICLYRMKYFERMGIDVRNINNISYNKYKQKIEREDIKKLIPPKELAKAITKCRENKIVEAQKEYIYTSQDFIENTSAFDDNQPTKEAIYEKYKNKFIGISTVFNVPVLFFTVNSGDAGILDYIFLHELCHVGELSKNSENAYASGFDFINIDFEPNPYNPQKRKYERLNENIADIFTMEAREVLHKKGIYIFEPKEQIIADVSNRNTSSITKKMLKHLLTKYRKHVIKARISGNMEELFNIIGSENFEALNDSINIVDYLVSHGLEQKLKNNQNEDSLVVQYNKQLERLEQIYSHMDVYYSKHNLAPDGR